VGHNPGHLPGWRVHQAASSAASPLWKIPR
jgi:hypothetical protein